MLSIIIILSIALAIFLGYRTKINTGLFCIVFAYIIGCFVMGLKPKQIIGFWPTSTMFVILSVSLFYNFAAINGTLEKMSGALLYACRNFPGLLPYALFAVAVILSVMGATFFTVLAFLAPITLVICDESRMDKLTGAVAINCGALAGGNFPTSNLGVVFRGLSDTAYEASPEIAAVDSFNMEMKIFAFAIFFSLILITIFRFGFKENRNIGKGVTFKKPESFTKDQKTTLTLMMAMMAVVLIFPLLNILMPGNAAVKYISGKVDVGLVAIIFTVIALLLKLAPQKEAIAKVPWNTIIMIAGAGMLIAVAVEAGTIEALLDRFQCTKASGSYCFLPGRCHHEFLQFHYRSGCSGIVPADPESGCFCRFKRAGIICLHDPWCPVQRYQSIFFRRFPDPWFHPERGRTQ